MHHKRSCKLHSPFLNIKRLKIEKYIKSSLRHLEEPSTVHIVGVLGETRRLNSPTKVGEKSTTFWVWQLRRKI